jgi:hypothetical protein
MRGPQGPVKSLGGANIGHLVKTGQAEKLLFSVHGKLQLFTLNDFKKINGPLQILLIVY